MEPCRSTSHSSFFSMTARKSNTTSAAVIVASSKLNIAKKKNEGLNQKMPQLTNCNSTLFLKGKLKKIFSMARRFPNRRVHHTRTFQVPAAGRRRKKQRGLQSKGAPNMTGQNFSDAFDADTIGRGRDARNLHFVPHMVLASAPVKPRETATLLRCWDP